MTIRIAAIVILDSEGARISCRYFNHFAENKTLTNYAAQIKLENILWTKSARVSGRTEAEAILTDDLLCICKPCNDFSIFVIADKDENELILLDVINCVYEGLLEITSSQLCKKSLFEQLDQVSLLLDEIVDGSGIIIESDNRVVIHRLQMQDGEYQEHTAFNQAFHSARENLMRSFLNS